MYMVLYSALKTLNGDSTAILYSAQLVQRQPHGMKPLGELPRTESCVHQCPLRMHASGLDLRQSHLRMIWPERRAICGVYARGRHGMGTGTDHHAEKHAEHFHTPPHIAAATTVNSVFTRRPRVRPRAARRGPGMQPHAALQSFPGSTPLELGSKPMTTPPTLDSSTVRLHTSAGKEAIHAGRSGTERSVSEAAAHKWNNNDATRCSIAAAAAAAAGQASAACPASPHQAIKHSAATARVSACPAADSGRTTSAPKRWGRSRHACGWYKSPSGL